MTAWFDRLTLLALVATLGLIAGDIAGQKPRSQRVSLPLLLPEDAPGSLHMPEADRLALRARAASVGEVLTVEDLVRVSLALSQDKAAELGLGELPPLTEAERAALLQLLQTADRHRRELLAVEGELAQAEATLNDASSRMAAALRPEQRRWIQENRNAVSVGEVEEAYWAAAQEALR
jgi:hypothetical protein